MASEWHDIGLKNYKNLSKWYLDIAGRDAVRLAYIMSAEAGNDDQWDEATAAYRGG